MSQRYYFIIQDRRKKKPLIEFASTVPPPNIGQRFNMKNAASDYEFVEVIEIEQLPDEERTVVKVTVKPVQEQQD